jgi:hypothetical protein
MKNIHVLPTEKPSRLWKNNLLQGILVLNEDALPFNTAKNIYITSDEEIKEGDWFMSDFNSFPIHNIKELSEREGTLGWEQKDLKNNLKIIITTDQDLIKDGVQSIDDEFLEWFVKNPSCEFVEVKSKMNHPRNVFGYEIIIPKEEPKFEDSIENSLSIMSIANDMFGKKEEPKQEKICTGCGTLSSEELGKNKLGENFLACCPDSDYVNVQEYQEYGLLQHIKFCLESGNEAQAIRLIEKYGNEKQEQECDCDNTCDKCEEKEKQQILQEAREKAKQEQKQHLIDLMKLDEELGLYDEPKQETLEEVAERLYKKGCNIKEKNIEIYRRIFIDGVKWQQEQICNHNYNLISEQGHRVIKCSKCNHTQPI